MLIWLISGSKEVLDWDDKREAKNILPWHFICSQHTGTEWRLSLKTALLSFWEGHVRNIIYSLGCSSDCMKQVQRCLCKDLICAYYELTSSQPGSNECNKYQFVPSQGLFIQIAFSVSRDALLSRTHVYHQYLYTTEYDICWFTPLLFYIAQIAPLSFQGSHRTQTQTSEVRWLHPSVVTEWSPACLHKQFPGDLHRGN